MRPGMRTRPPPSTRTSTLPRSETSDTSMMVPSRTSTFPSCKCCDLPSKIGEFAKSVLAIHSSHEIYAYCRKLASEVHAKRQRVSSGVYWNQQRGRARLTGVNLVGLRALKAKLI